MVAIVIKRISKRNRKPIMNRGILYGIIAYTIWGLLPIYWKLLKQFPALEIMSQRVVWLLVVLVIILALRKQWGWLARLDDRRIILTSIAAAALLALNWFVYIWGVNAGFIIETSLGYFINPLVNVVLGVVLLGERIRPGQWLAVGIAAAGVLYLTINYGSLPWIALTLAFSFAFYGLLKKRSSLGSVESLTVEATLMAPVALDLSDRARLRGRRCPGPHRPLHLHAAHRHRHCHSGAAALLWRCRQADSALRARIPPISGADDPISSGRLRLQ